MTLAGNDLDTVLLVNKAVTMMGQGDRLLEEMAPKETGLELFYMKSLFLVRQDKGVKMVMVLKRKPTTELLTTFLPSILLMTITFATTFLAIENIEAGLGANLTIMLLLLTIFTSKIAELPPTSEVKMIDTWLVCCLLYPFVEVLLQILLLRLSKDDNKVGKLDGDRDWVAAARLASCSANTLKFAKWLIPGEGESAAFRVFKVIGEYKYVNINSR
jgi:hypothetical protein